MPSQLEGNRAVADRPQVMPHERQPTIAPARDVLDDDPARRELLEDAPVLFPESGARSLEPGSEPGARDVLTGESTTDELDALERCGSGSSNIRHTPIDLGPVPREHRPTPAVNLDLPANGTEARER